MTSTGPVDAANDDADVVYLTPQGAVEVGERTTDNLEAARAAQRRRRAEFEYLLAGAEKRAAKLPKALIGSFGHGVANLMLIGLLNGTVVPQTAKEAAEVAKITQEMALRAQGRGPADGPLTPDERKTLLDQAAQLEKGLAARAKAISDEFLAGAPATPDEALPEVDEPIEWDLDDENPNDGAV